MEIHPLYSYILQNGCKRPDGETWLDLANKFGVSPEEPDPERRAKRTKDRWLKWWKRNKEKFRDGLFLKQVKEDGDGEVVTRTFGALPNPAADKADLELVGVSEAPSGGAWNIYRKTKPPYAGLTPEQRKEFEEKRDDAERAKISKHLDFKSESSGDFENWLILGCVHVPGHNRHLWEGVLTYLNETKVDGIILAGDFMDFKSLSSHEKGQDRGVTYWDELMAGCEAIDELESVLRKNAKRVFLNGNHCFSSDTELLTENGWMNMEEYLKSDVRRIATYDIDAKSILYEEPERVISKRYKGEMHHWVGQKIDVLVTPEHKMFHLTQHGNPRFATSNEIKNRCIQFVTAAHNHNEEYNISDDEIRLAAWVQTDGRIIRNAQMLYQSKIENVEKIEKLLIRMGLDFRKTSRDRDIKSICGIKLKSKPLTAYEFYIKANQFKLVEKRKRIDDWVYKLSHRQFEIFLDTLILADGSRHKSSPIKSCMLYGMRDFLEQVQLLCVMNGHSASLSTYRGNQFRLNIHKWKDSATLNSSSAFLNFNEVDYDGHVWCFTMSKGTVISRRNGKISIQGNCDRYYRVLKEIENSRFGDALISPQKGLKLEARGWQYLNNWKEDYVLLGNNLEVVHGIYLSKNAAKTHLDAAAQVGRSVVFFHTHRMGTADNGTNTAWNCGFLGDKDSEVFRYVPRQVRQGWTNGFCLVTIDGRGQHYVTPVRCSDKHFFVSGKKYGG
jgi:predicted phosphodiesterase